MNEKIKEKIWDKACRPYKGFNKSVKGMSKAHRNPGDRNERKKTIRGTI